jgi:hypothetical protein
MTPPAEQATRAMGLRSRRRRAAIIAAAVWLLFAQTLLAVHRIDHNAEQHAACALCVVADHAGGPIYEPIHAIPAPESVPVAVTVAESAPVLIVLSYYSRGPPAHLRS